MQALRESLDNLASQLTQLAIEHNQLSRLAGREADAATPRDGELIRSIAKIGKSIRDIQGVTMRLPLSTPSFEALVARVGDQSYFLRLDLVAEVIRPGLSTLTHENQVEFLRTRDGKVPVLRLADWLGRQSSAPLEGVGAALIVRRADGARLAIVVDDVLETQRILLKPLGADLAELPGFAGASLALNGTAALVLDVQQILEAAG